MHESIAGTALRNLERYAQTHMPGVQVAIRAEGGTCRLIYDLPLSDREACRQNAEGAAAVALQLLRRLAGPEWRPHRVLFGHRRPRGTVIHEKVFGVAPTFGADVTAAFLFDAKTLDQVVPGADRRLLPIVEKHLDELLASMADHWIGELRTVVARTVCDGHPALRAIARRVGLSERTLQRRLGERGLVWKDVVLDVRRELAQGYLARDEMPLTEIAFLLGYSELSAFDRAFRKWTGVTPMEWRRRADGGRRSATPVD
jgi:AraC-like DNA-binding protein